MADKKEKEVNVESKEIKNEAKNTFDDVKDTIKNVKFQDDAKATTGFVSQIFKDPLQILKKTASDKKNSNLKHALILVFLWIIAILIVSIGDVAKTRFLPAGTRFMNVFKDLLEPIIGLIAMSSVIYFNQNGAKKSLTTIFTTVTVASIPTILLSVIRILRLFSTSFGYILTPLSLFTSAITLIFIYFATKDIVGEEENSVFIKKFMVIEFAYFVCYFIFQFVDIYLPLL